MLIALVAGVVVGLLIGGLGGGGAVLTVPVLVYAVGKDPHEATTASLVIVGVSSLVGLVPHHRRGAVQWGQGVTIGVLGVGGAYLGTRAAAGVDGNLLLAMFAGLLVVVAALMIRKALVGSADVEGRPRDVLHSDDEGMRDVGGIVKLVVTATGVGLLTGFFGVGGGFAIVPALTLVLGYGMPFAVGTSLLVVTINSVSSFLFHSSGGSVIDWSIVTPFLAMAVAGALVGGRLVTKIPKRTLQLGFASLLLLVSFYTAWRSIPHLF